MQAQKFLERFFEEKVIPYKVFEIKQGAVTHLIDNEAIIDLILNAPTHEQKQISDIIRRIDFANGDLNHFLEHLAKGFLETQSAHQRQLAGTK